MYKISIFVNNIQKYGNCKFYGTVPNPHANTMIDLHVLENGKLGGIARLEVFDRVYWDGVSIDETAKKMTSIELDQYCEDTLPNAIATLIYGSLYDEKALLVTKRAKTASDTHVAIHHIYSIVSAMLQLSILDVMQWPRLDEVSIKRMLIEASKNRKLIELAPEQAIHLIECDMDFFATRLAMVNSIWKRMQNSDTKEAYNQAYQEWQELSEKEVSRQFQKSIKL